MFVLSALRVPHPRRRRVLDTQRHSAELIDKIRERLRDTRRSRTWLAISAVKETT